MDGPGTTTITRRARTEQRVVGRQPGSAAPPRWKMALVTWATLFPLITVIVELTGPPLAGLPLAARLAITTGLAVPLMSWVVMPRVTQLARGWLFARPNPSRNERSD